MLEQGRLGRGDTWGYGATANVSRSRVAMRGQATPVGQAWLLQMTEKWDWAGILLGHLLALELWENG